MTGHAVGIDHVGVVGPALEDLARSFAALGFVVTPRATHQGGRTGNHCVMLDQSYLELVSMLPGGTSATLVQFLQRYAGMHILALRIADPDAAAARLGRGGFADLAPAISVRALSDTDATEVGFTLVTPPDLPEGRVHLIHHRDPEVMWQRRFMAHPNGAVRLAEIAIATRDPAQTASAFSAIAGRPVAPDSAGGYVLDTGGQRLRFLPPTVGGEPSPALPWIGVLTLHTADGNNAIRRLVARGAMAHDIKDEAVVVRCAGVVMRFLPSPA